ncbi:uncharacterized protein LOC134817884 isoform X2 [Bolinopsis microptera]|uniref:uncharacterized protein LOC134817884 isoform X2 n=1 Tax=Bolinopsis microptera TaxID=2820187 RepID=UPI00307A058D
MHIETKTLFPDSLPPTPRTLLCHHATDKSGHITCEHPGKCNIHKLTKPSAFEVSKLDQCRTVIDLYEQGVMGGVINAEQSVSRDATNQRYSHNEYGDKCEAHSNCNGDCGTHGTPATTQTRITTPRTTTTTTPSLSPAALAYTPDTKQNIDKQIVVARTPDAKLSSAKLTTYGDQVKKRKGLKKQVTFSDNIKVKCVNPNCGRTSILGESCESESETSQTKSAREMISLVPQKERPPPKKATCGTADTNRICKRDTDKDKDCDTSEQILLPSCYYQHARNRMTRLKDKSKTLAEKAYSPPSSLAKPAGPRSFSLVQKYNNAKQNKIKKKKFVIPNVNPDCLYQPSKPRRPRKTPLTFHTGPRPPPPQYRINMRDIYPRKRSGKVSLRGRANTRANCWDDEVGPTIKVAVDDVGPLVYAVQNGKIRRMKIEGSTQSCQLEI